MKAARGFLFAIPWLWLAASAAHGGDTDRVGGSGGKLVRFECGAGSFLTGVSVTSGSYTLYDMVLLRRLRFSCRVFDDSSPGDYDVAIDASVTPKYSLANEQSGSADCPRGHAMSLMKVKAGAYIDRLIEMHCRPTGSLVPVTVPIGVGGNGGTIDFFSCPSGQALYRIDARADDAVDSLQGFCRRFPPVQMDMQALLSTINASFTPKPPLNLAISGSPAQVTFVVPQEALNKRMRVLFNAPPSSSAMVPTYRIELVDPTGKVAVAQTAMNAGVVGITFAVAGVWKINLRSLTPASAVKIQGIGVTVD